MTEATSLPAYVRPDEQDDSLEVHRHRWMPPEGVAVKPRGVYLLHGTGEHGGRYERLALHLAAEGYPVAAHDHPGHGRSGGPRGLIPLPGSYATRAAIEFKAFERDSGATPFLFGHSLGGVVASELVILHRLPVAGLLLSAPAIVPNLRWQDALKLKIYMNLIPRHTVSGEYDPTRLTHDTEQQKIARADPLIHSFKSAEFVAWLMAAARRVLASAEQLNVETLLMIAGSDVVINTDRTREFAARAPQELLTVKTYADCHHELLNEGPELRAQVEGDILAWLEGRAGSSFA